MIKLSVWAMKRLQSRVRENFYPLVRTTFLTKDGPLPGTHWYFKLSTNRQMFTVEKVEDGIVYWTDEPLQSRTSSVEDFLASVARQEFVLMGVTGEVHSRTEI